MSFKTSHHHFLTLQYNKLRGDPLRSKKPKSVQHCDHPQHRIREKVLADILAKRRLELEAEFLGAEAPSGSIAAIESAPLEELLRVATSGPETEDEMPENESTAEKEVALARIKAMSPEKRERLRNLSTALLAFARQHDNSREIMSALAQQLRSTSDARLHRDGY